MSSEVAISVESLSKRYEIFASPRERLKQFVLPNLNQILGWVGGAIGLPKRTEPCSYYREFWALRDVSFSIRRGETVGIVGRNGSGKSTLLQLIAGTLTPTTGDIKVYGRVTALLELGSGFNPEFTGRENVFLNGSIAGVSPGELEKRFSDIESFADIGEFIDRPVKTYSTGMILRLAFATQIALDPKILIVDEALAVGDAPFQIKCYGRMKKLREGGTTILFVSHDKSAVLSFCDRALYLNEGRVAGWGPTADVVRQYEGDCIRSKMVAAQLATEGTGVPVSTGVASEHSTTAKSQALMEILRGYNFAGVAAGGKREGSGSVSIESFCLLRNETITTLIHPNETITGCFLLRFNKEFSGQLHAAIHIRNKQGLPIVVIRDSIFDKTVSGSCGEHLLVKMEFSLPLSTGTYYCQIGALLFPPGHKFQEGRFHFESAEIADLVDCGYIFEMLPLEHYAITDPVLIEAELILDRVEC